ncbi:zinc transporter ZupT [Microbacter margulisiae]|uniref:ZIP family zinc transporter n=1 Tax=Microbacter margulisiae TaxID=1350067 RepID=A0A7W5H1X6_9PORP|nr:zinc transporter ZupT [Microbacter margulisiae]MBB3187054.1 ZIP family zinc transporter [Microbacter margulisiae]
MISSSIIIAFSLTLIAGLSTGIGSWLTFFTHRTNRSFLSFSLGLAAGVLLFVSFIDIFPESQSLFQQYIHTGNSFLWILIAFFAGIGLMLLLDWIAPHHDHTPSESNTHVHSKNDPASLAHLKRLGMMVAIAVSLHNVPEGIAIFTVGISHINVAIPILFAIVLHNIPIGVSISAPIYQATGKKQIAFLVAILTGMASPFGAILAWLFLLPSWTPLLQAIVLGAVSGTMVYIALIELLPSAECYGKHTLTRIGLISGMITMGVTIYLLG